MSKRSASGAGQSGEATSANPGTASAPTPARKVATKRAPPPKVGAAARPVAKRTDKVQQDAAKSAGRPATVKASAKAEKTPKPKKARLVRDSFTMPETEHALLGEVKRRCIANGLVVKKSEVLRAAIIGLAAQDDASLRAAVLALAVIKVGRPPKKRK